jgi:predicted aspartyl protease
VISRRALISRLPLLAAVGAGAWLLRDRIPWPQEPIVLARGDSSGWIPFPDRGGLIELPGAVNGQPARAVVDSGAQFTAVDSGLAARLELPETGALPVIAFGVSGQPTITRTVRLDLTLPGVEAPGVRAAALQLARLSAATGRTFAVLVGRDVLRRLVLDVDFPARRVAFHRPGAWATPPDAVALPLRLQGGAPMTTIRVEGRPVEVMIDTGATGVLALSARVAQDVGLLAPGRPVSSARSVSLGGLSVDRIVQARSVEAAGVTLRDAPVQIYAPSSSGPIPQGLLGAGFLRRFRMALDLEGKRLLLARPGVTVLEGN